MIARPKAIGLVLFGAIVLGVAAPASAQSQPKAPLIQSSYVYQYARYYAPYALQAAAAYLSVGELDRVVADGKLQPNSDAPGADVDYVARQAISDETIRPRALEAIKSWRYQFGSDAYLTCIDADDVDCQNAYQNRGWALSSGPAFQVWARTRFPHRDNEACSEVSIAFRGTTGSFGDWTSKGDQIVGWTTDDYYHQLRRNIDAIMKKVAALDCYRRARSRPQIVTVGHSLGGGLAQLAALATGPKSPQVAKVFAFDPSPVTGYNLVDARLLKANARRLTIDRIHETGEVLSRFLSLDQQYPKSTSACDPLVRTVTVDAFEGTAVQLHGIAPLAARLVQLSYDGDTRLSYSPPPGTPCGVRYRPPATDQDDLSIASIGSGRTAFASMQPVFQIGDRPTVKVRRAKKYLGLPRQYAKRGKLAMAFKGPHKSKRLRTARS